MKKIAIASALLALLFTTTSCRDEFLQSKPTGTLSNPPAQSKLYGLYLMMIKTRTGGTASQDDFGQKGYDIYSDLLSSDMVLGGVNYGHYGTIADYTSTVDYTNTNNYKPWRYYYRIIYAANSVIAGLGGNDVTPAKEDDRYAMGQAKAMRAYGYFYLMQFYNNKYEPNAPAIPLYTTASVDAKGKSKQSEVYQQIQSDLTSAITLLDGYRRPNKGVINQDIAKGLLAYTYAAIGENSKAATLSKEIIGHYPITTREETVYSPEKLTGGGFNDLKTKSWMWGFDITEENALDLVSWWGQADIFTYSYSYVGDTKSIDLGLYSQIKDGDIRKKQFANVVRTKGGYKLVDPMTDVNGYKAVAVNKFYAPGRDLGGQRSIIADYIFMRVDEFHLLAAETLAKSGDVEQAKSILKNFLKERLDDVSYIDALSKEDLEKEIYLQTRIELWGEGKSYLAMKRNKATVVRGDNHIYYAGQSFRYDDNKLTFKIPQGETNNNPNID